MAQTDDKNLKPSSQCTVCSKTFRRAEHLRRHFRSHTDDKPFVCSICGKRFARSDTLLRHEANHQTLNSIKPMDPAAAHAFRACRNCAVARVRCSGEGVCSRCEGRGLDCEYPSKRQKRSSTTASMHDLEAPTQAESELITTTTSPPTIHAGDEVPSTYPYDAGMQPAPFPTQHHQLQAGTIHSAQSSAFSTNDSLDPGWYGQQAMLPPDPLAPEQDFVNQSLNWIPLSVYPSPYGPDIDEAFQYMFPSYQVQQGSQTPGLPSNASVIMSAPPDQSPTSHPRDFTRTGSNAGIASSPSSGATPVSGSASSVGKLYRDGDGSRDTASQQSRRKLSKSMRGRPSWQERRDGDIRFAFPQIEAGPHRFIAHPETLNCIRGHFLQLCTGQQAVFTPFFSDHFPLDEVVNMCIDLYFEHFHSSFPLLHRPTFGSGNSHWLLVLAVAAIGSNFIDSIAVAKLRDAFQEFLRRATSTVTEIYKTPEIFIPVAQARILNLIALVSAENSQSRAHVPRYHVELSRSCLESGILQDTRASIGIGDDGQDGTLSDLTHRAWHEWLIRESRHRTAYCIWLMDCTVGYLADSRPLCTLDDARAPLPCSETLWNAPSAAVWSALHKSYPEQPSLCSAVETLYMKKSIAPSMSDLSHILLIHALYQKTWDTGKHLKQPLSDWVPTAKTRGFLATPSKDTFWLPSYPLYENWRNSACDCLDVLHWHASSVVAKASGMEHANVLHLHLARVILLSPFQEIHDLIFSLIGRYGTSTTATFFVHDGSYQTQNMAKIGQVRQITWRWLREDQHKARLAMIHAGSVFWHVRRYSTNSFYEPAAIYLASIALWAYGSYKTAALRKGNVVPAKLVNGNSRTTELVLRAEDGGANEDASQKSVSDVDTESSDEPPEFIHLDRPCDDEIVQHFVRQGHNMSGNMSNVGDICQNPERVLKEGAKLLKSRLTAWGVSREYFDILTALSEVKKG